MREQALGHIRQAGIVPGTENRGSFQFLVIFSQP